MLYPKPIGKLAVCLRLSSCITKMLERICNVSAVGLYTGILIIESAETLVLSAFFVPFFAAAMESAAAFAALLSITCGIGGTESCLRNRTNSESMTATAAEDR